MPVEDYAESNARELAEMVESHSGSSAEKLRTLLSTDIFNRTPGGAPVRALDSIGAEMPADTKVSFEKAWRKILDLHVRAIRDASFARGWRPESFGT